MVRRDPLLLQAIRLLSQSVAKNEPFYTETSCLNPPERELLGYIKAYKILFGENETIARFGKALKFIGIAKWPRTELTDLGLNIGSGDTETETFETPIESMEEEQYSEVTEEKV